MPAHRVPGPPPRPRRRLTAGVLALTTVLTPALVSLTSSAEAATVSTAVFSGSGAVSANGTLFAKQGTVLTLTVTTSADTQCVDVAGAFTAHQESAVAKSTWTFPTTAPAGDGAKSVTASASTLNRGGNCSGTSATVQGTYTLDNTGPGVTAALTPAPNAAGWNSANVDVRWTATDAGVGVAAAQPFKTESVTANGTVELSAPAQTDRLGNTGTAGATTVRVDKQPPTISAAQTKNVDGTTTVTFTCADAVSGIASCLANGSTTNSRTVQPGVTVTGTATDAAGNTSTASSTAPAGDTTAPVLSGAATTQPNDNGWYKR